MQRLATPRHWAAAALVAALVLPWLPSGRVHASEQLRKQMAEFARDVKKFLDGRGETSIAVGEFTGPPQLACNPGPGLVLLLNEELVKLKVAVKARAKLGLSGEFRPVTDEESKQLAMELKVKVVNSVNKALQVFSYGILGAPDIAVLCGLNSEPPVPGTPAKRKKQMEEDLDNPRVALEGTKVTNGKGRPYAVELLVNEVARLPRMSDDLPFVRVERGELYTLRLTNRSDYEAGVVVAIDGIDVFAFNEDPDPDGVVRKEFHVIVPKRGTALVQGWYRKNGKSDSFMVTGYSDSAAAQLVKSTAKIGSITCVFKACWPKGANPPADEGGTLSGNATGFGPPVEERYVRLERSFGQMRAAITVRYSKR